MKQEKMVTLTLVNGLCLLVFASLLSSCQKSSIKATGHFTSKLQSRAVASSAPGTIDPRQIFVYCSVSSPDSKSCFSKNVEKLGVNTLKSYPALKVEVAQVTNSIISGLGESLDQQVEKRRDFCLKNASYFFNKCMSQYVERDSMGTLNAYFKKNPSITGYEYLFLKDSISKAYSAKLQIEMTNIEEFQKKSI
jgi:hypothetical protein